MIIASPAAETFVKGLNVKFEGQYKFHAMPGRKYDRIVREIIDTRNGGVYKNSRSAFAFVECATGYVFKASGWKAPAQGVRYTDVVSATSAADAHGNFLYVR